MYIVYFAHRIKSTLFPTIAIWINNQVNIISYKKNVYRHTYFLLLQSKLDYSALSSTSETINYAFHVIAFFLFLLTASKSPLHRYYSALTWSAHSFRPRRLLIDVLLFALFHTKKEPLRAQFLNDFSCTQRASMHKLPYSGDIILVDYAAYDIQLLRVSVVSENDP